jgi:oxygen-dependent protoporphyrinogen oxidase
MLARRPEGLDLARAAGLGDALQPPATGTAAIWTRGEVRPMPTGHLMGVPADPAVLGGVLSPDGLARAAEDAELPRTEIGEDVAVGEYVAARLGREVVDRLVEPLLGGVYAGDAYRISLRASVPALFEAARKERSLLAAVRGVQERAAARRQDGPVFMGIEGGMGRLPGAVADTCRAAGAEILTGTPAEELRRTGKGWTVTAGGRAREADAVVLAVPAPAAARLLAGPAPSAAAELSGVEYASMALVTMAFRRRDLASVPEGRGFLVPAVDGRMIKASTFSTNKWHWNAVQDPGLFVLRTSLGRYGEEEVLGLDDADLVEASLRDLGAAIGLTARPVASTVTRWNDGLPQYPVGHLERVARVRRHLAALPGLAVCGAAYDARGGRRGGHPGVRRRGPRRRRGGARRRRSGRDSGRDSSRCRGPSHRPPRPPRENEPMTAEPRKTPNAGKKAKDLNEVIRYTLWSVFRLREALPEDRAGYADEVQELFDQLAAKDVTVRGTYDVSGLRADADVMIWWHAETADALQEAYNLFRRTRLGRALEPVWSNMALHRPAEFNRSHIPAFLADEEPRAYVCVYPFVRSYEWYVLPDEERREMLAEHGKMARGYPDVRANTVASFALGDYEWLLAFEADELHRIVDLMRHLRASRARLHVREEIPFYTGRRKQVAELVAGLA